MEKKNLILLPAAIGVIIAGLVLILSPMVAVFVYKTLDTVVGILLILLFTIIGAMEISTSRAIYGTQVGEWPGIVRFIAISALLRLMALFLLKDIFLMLTLISFALEGMALGLLFWRKQDFMLSEEEIQSALKRFETVSYKTSSQCPKCGGIVEPDWTLCPDCGTRLPKFCSACGGEIHELDDKCCACGVIVEVPVSLLNMVETLKKTADMPAASETRSVRYARLGEAQLKAGRLDEAMESYKVAIQYTQFDRKKTNFMVKMAVVMANKGKLNEAEQLLDAAVQLDPEDVAGAASIKRELRSPPTCPI